MKLKFKKPLTKAIFRLYFLAWILLESNAIEKIKVNPPTKFIEVKILTDDLVIEKEFESPSFTRLTCAASALVMGKDAYSLIEQVCQIIAKIPPIDPFKSDELALETRDTINVRINEKKQDAPEDLFVGLIQPINNTAEEMLQFVALLPNGAECLVESIPIPPKQRLFMAYNTKDKNLYYCFGIREGEGTYPHRVGCYHLDLLNRTQGWKILNSSAIDVTSNSTYAKSPSIIDNQMYAIARAREKTGTQPYTLSVLRYNLTAKDGWTQVGPSWERRSSKVKVEQIFMGKYVLEMTRYLGTVTKLRYFLNKVLSDGIKTYELNIRSNRKGPRTLGSREPAKVIIGEGKEGYLLYASKNQIYIFTLNEKKPKESKWTLYNSPHECRRCKFFNLGRDNILAIGVNNKLTTKFNLVKEQLVMKRNTTLLKTRTMISTTILLKFVINLICSQSMIVRNIF